jgi:rhamnosyl/mannosyltransferase
MRILHSYKIYYPDVFGGIPEVIAALVVGMQQRAESSVLVARPRGWHRSLDVDGASVEAVASIGQLFSMPLAPAFPFVLKQRARNVDVVALHQPFPLNDLGVTLGLPPSAALVVHWHADIVAQRWLAPVMAYFVGRTLARAQRIILSDDSILRRSPDLAPHQSKCAVVPFGVDCEYWGTLDREQVQRVELLRDARPRLIVSSSRLVAYKGLDVLIRALCGVDAHLIIVGQGPLRETLAATARNLGVDRRITFAGAVPRDELKIYLHAARVFAFPSVSAAETFGISQLEAMAVGLPVVNAALPTGVPRVARHGLEAITVPPRDHEKLAEALSHLLAHPDLAVRLGSAGRMRAAQEYPRSRFVAAIESIYGEAVDALLGSAAQWQGTRMRARGAEE